MPSDTDPIRSYTRRLARTLAAEDGALALGLLQRLSAAGAAPAAPRSAPVDPRDLGIWRLDDDGTHLRRPDLKADWQFWADLERLPPATGHRRVAVLGESVARGYFFDPATTYAGLVGDCLRSLPGLTDVDVLDLARTNANAEDIRRILAELASVAPDAIVVFAGNNWYQPTLTDAERRLMADALRAGGYPAAQRLFHAAMVARAREFLDGLAATAADYGAEVVLVVPEFNLADWHEEPFLACPVLPGAGNLAWQRLRERAERQLAAGETAEAAGTAVEMIALDGGGSVAAHRLLASALAGDDPAGAERALRNAKDAAVGRFAPHAPRMLTAVQETMRAKAAEHGFALVDLPEILRRAADGRTPGREHFLDYCHLNHEGLALAAAWTAAALGTRLGGRDDRTDPAAIAAALTPPAAAGQAAAHFLAAIHNAHIGQPAEIVRYLLERALTLDEGVAAHLAEYLDYQSRLAPNWICASFERSARVPELARYLEVGDPQSAAKLADHDLRQTMLDLLAERGAADPDAYRRLLIAEHARPEVDLLTDISRAPTWREQFGSTGQPHPFVVAPGPHTYTWLVLAGPAEVELGLTARLPAGDPGEALVGVLVNGVEVASVGLGPEWRSTRTTVPAQHWRPGLNRVTLSWPLREIPGDRLLEEAARTLERGGTPRSNPARGHLHVLTASVRSPTA
ncbi:hypothetical protein [Kitasatospora terrestris]|uniref:SGNH hydrolase-type esterase domain-containing protein n=1 Tax=Kitasatospora terrestris TaxID=258051 RepID=A0ABP9D8W4_9ACTN